LTKDDFVIITTIVSYTSPISPERPVEIASTTSTPYFFCKDVVYIPAMMSDESSSTQSLIEARRLKSEFFESSDVASYLRKIK